MFHYSAIMTIDSSPYEKLQVSLSDLFPIDQNYAFLAGAGISMDTPTKMPSAVQMVKEIFKLVAPDEEISHILGLESLRFELAVELIQNVIDIDLKFLNFMEEVKTPNLIHYFLSRFIVKGSNVITTNFDYLLEYALKQILPPNKQTKIRLMITKMDFLEAATKPETLQHQYNLVKIHGSKRDIITNENTQDSLIATVSALGRDREDGKIFAIEPYKKEVMYSLLNNQTLVVMGYSGNDDFDISPLLLELPYISRLIWIDHTNRSGVECFRFTGKSTGKGQEKSPLIEFLTKIKKKQGFETILIRANTKSLIENNLWSIFHANTPIDFDVLQQTPFVPDFQEYITDLYGNLGNLQKYHLASELYYKLKQVSFMERCATRGLVSATTTNALAAKSTFFNYLGLSSQIQGNYTKSLDYYARALLIDEELGNFHSQASLLNNLGTVYMQMGEYSDALPKFELSLRISDELKDKKGKVTSLNNIGQIYENMTQTEKALSYYNLAIELSQNIGDLGRSALLHNNIGKILSSEDSNLAIMHYKKALKITELLGDLQGQNILYNNIGRVLADKGDLQTAISMFKKSVAIAEKLGDNSKKAGALSNLGSMSLVLNDLDQALNYFQEASKLEDEHGNPHLSGIYYNNIGMIYQQTGKNDKAIDAYKISLEKFESISAYSNIALVYSKLGDCYMVRTRYSESLKYYLSAKKIYSSPELDDPKNLAAITSNLGRCYEILGKHDDALRCYEESLEIDEKLGDPTSLAIDYFNIGKIQKTQNHLPVAVDNLRKSLDLFIQLGMTEQVESIKQLLNSL